MSAAPDIFISYAHADRETARRFADAFAAEGLVVWWDNDLRSGEVFDEKIEAALRAAKAVIVLWSPHSVVSRWVRAEATLADRNKTLVPVIIAPCERPIVFELMQTAQFAHWQGAREDAAWIAFAGEVREFLGQTRENPAANPVSASTAGAAAARLDQLSVVVLPFANMSSDPEQDYFADGISEDIITDLSKVSSLGVISRNSSFAFKGKHVDVPDVARQLNVTHVLEGSVRKAGNRVRVTAQLIDGSTNDHIWAERWDRDLDDIFALQDELSQEIVKALKLKLLPQEKKAIEDRGTTNLEAYDKFLRARAAGNAVMDADGFAAAVELYWQALEIDPRLMQAYSSMATLLRRSLVYLPDRRDQTIRDVETLSEKARLLEPGAWVTQQLEGTRLLQEKCWIDGIAAYEQAIALAPSADTDLMAVYADQIAGLGRIKEAVAVMEAVRAADPLATFASASLQMFYLIDGRYDASETEYQRSLTLQGAPEVREHTALMRVWMRGDKAASRKQFTRFLDSRIVTTPFLERCVEMLEDSAACIAILREAFEDPANQGGTRMMIIAAHAGLHGDDDLAVAALRRMVDFDFPAQFVIWWPFLRKARQKPAFKALARDIGLHDYWRQSGNWGDFARPLGDDDFEVIG